MSDYVTITEHVRINGDGSSDHIKVIDGELLSVDHFDVAPFYRIDPEIAWFIHIGRTSPEVAERLRNNNGRTTSTD